MYCYFSSEYPAAVKLNGAYLGRVDGEPRGVSLEENVLVEICPLNSGGNYNFYVDKNFFLSPPPYVCVADLKGGYLIRIAERPRDNDFNVVAQQKNDFAAVTVFYDGGLKLSLETPQGFFSDSFSFTAKKAEISFGTIDSYDFAFVFFKEKRFLCVYAIHGEPKKVLSLASDGFSLMPFTTVLSVNDMAKHKITRVWNYLNGEFTVKSTTVERAESFTPSALPEKLVPYAFLEELCVGKDCLYYLSDEIIKNADKLRDYLGNFIGVMPPPVFRAENEIGLIYKISENKYSVDYVTVQTENGKIVNLKRSET